jgi:membrane associated rhomboid family serine protease
VIPIKDYNPTKRTAYVTLVLIAICIGIYFFVQPGGQSSLLDSDPRSEQEQVTQDLEFNLEHAAIPCELLTGEPLSQEEVVRTFRDGDDTACERNDESPPFDPQKNVYLAVLYSMFLHGSILHLGGNMLFLWVFGNNIEDRVGMALYLVFYLVAGVAATVAHMAVQPESTIPMVGASGAISGVMGAYLVMYPNVRIRTVIILGIIFLIRDLPAKLILGFWFFMQFLTSPNSGVAWMAHVGGFAFGVLVGIAWRALGKPQRPQAVGWPV